MLTQEDVKSILEYINERLKDAKEHGVNLVVVDEQDTRVEDEWLYITVAPEKEGGRASDYAELMAKIEKELRKRNFNNVLLVPVLEE